VSKRSKKDEPTIGPRDGEKPEAHRAFILYLMLDPNHAAGGRSQNQVVRASGAPESNIRLWFKKYEWKDRCEALGPAADALAAKYYAEHYHPKHGGRSVEIIAHRMRIQYVPPAEEKLSATAKRADLATEEEKAAKGGELDPERVRLQSIIRAAKIRMSQQIARGSMRFSVSDLERLIKLEAQLNRPSLETTGGTAPAETLAKSERVLRAQAEGGDVLAAIEEDAQELMLILGSMRDHEEAKVVQLRTAKQPG
jgi:hypothetical protein